MEMKSVKLEKPAEVNMIMGQSHFIKSVEDIYEAIVNANPNAKFGIAFCESSQQCLVRVEGNDDEMKELAVKNALKLGAGHVFLVFLKNAFPINILNSLKMVNEVCGIYCATANDVEVVIAENEWGRGILGIIDGLKSKGVESEKDVKERRAFLRKIGYKF